MRRSVCGTVLTTMVLVGVGSLAAQETATPVFKAPYRAFENHAFGASFSDPEGADFALEGFYNYGRGVNDFGIRGGFIDAPGGTAIVVGGDFRTRVISYTEDFPLDGALTVGVGGVLGDDVEDALLIPVGVSLGRRILLEGSDVTFVPYIHPVLVPVIADDSDVEFALGLGVDLRLSRSFELRFSGGIGDIEGVGISAAFIR